jgi:hypothetical protein
VWGQQALLVQLGLQGKQGQQEQQAWVQLVLQDQLESALQVPLDLLELEQLVLPDLLD